MAAMVGESFNAVDVGECFDVVDRSVATTGRRKHAYGEGRVHFSFIGDNHSPRQPKQTIRKGVLVSLSTEVDEPIDVSDAVDITDAPSGTLMPFEDVMCMMSDMVKARRPERGISLKDIRQSKLGSTFFSMLLNCNGAMLSGQSAS